MKKITSKTEYDIQADKFLSDNNLTLSIVKAVPQKTPLWHKNGENHGIHYVCKLVKHAPSDMYKYTHETDISMLEKDFTNSYTFDFWDSIHNKENNIKPTKYRVLACIDTHSYQYTFEDFCFDYGYDEDSSLAQKTYKATIAQNEALVSLLTPEEIEQLNEIN